MKTHTGTRFVALFLLMAGSYLGSIFAAPTAITEQKPLRIEKRGKVIFVDFEKVAFANLEMMAPAGFSGEVTVHFGEKLIGDRIDRKPPGTVRYHVAKVLLKGGKATVVAPPADARNTKKTNDAHPPAILTPAEWGVVLPFRWVEIEGWEGELKPEQITRRAIFAEAWDEDAADFQTSDELLNRIWELCKYSIKATTFAGVYVDGDRERIPYEADSHLSQLSHYATSNDVEMARDTFDRLINFATWPSEWQPHMIFMAHADYMHTGDVAWLAPRYESLKTRTLGERAGKDGLITSNAAQMKKGDIVDWPAGERDGYKFTKVNTVVNAFHIRALRQMAELAKAVGKEGEAKEFSEQADKVQKRFQELLFDPKSGLYRDGVGTEHSSAHANFFPLAFDLVPREHVPGILKFLSGKGMACSVYATEYFMEALFMNGAEDKALALMTADGDRSWKHMVNSGTTITWEAWDMKYKPNQDWNHAWGAAPANLFPRFLLGVQPALPGWQVASIRPFTGSLENASGKVPTPRGAIEVRWNNGETFQMTVTLPKGMLARLDLPAPAGSEIVLVNGKEISAEKIENRWVVENEVSGEVVIEVK